MIKILAKGISLLNPLCFSAIREYCPICEKTRVIIKLDNDEIAVRCLGCKASAVSISIAEVINQEFSNLYGLSIYELSSRGPLFKYLKKKCINLTASEYFQSVESGHFYNNVLCQDVQKLSFPGNTFDLCTSTDVFEHVADDFRGFKNIYRVLKESGKFIFTVPLSGDKTIQRVSIKEGGKLEHLLSPEFHGDPNSSTGKILTFRNYGGDILDLLKIVGFATSKIVPPSTSDLWGYKRSVVVAQK